MGKCVCFLLGMAQQGLNCVINVIITFENGASRHFDLSWQVKKRHHGPHYGCRAQPCSKQNTPPRAVDDTQIRKPKNWIPRNVDNTYS